MNTFKLQPDTSSEPTLSEVEGLHDWSHKAPVVELAEASRACALVEVEQNS
jgi:hypothetical protein